LDKINRVSTIETIITNSIISGFAKVYFSIVLTFNVIINSSNKYEICGNPNYNSYQ
jgi:hypothetical protein